MSQNPPNTECRPPNTECECAFCGKAMQRNMTGRRRFYCCRAHGKAAERRRQDHGRRGVSRKTFPPDFAKRLRQYECLRQGARMLNGMPRMHRDFCRADIQTPPPEVLHGIAERPPLQIAALVNAARNALLHGRKNAARKNAAPPPDECRANAARCCCNAGARRDDFPPLRTPGIRLQNFRRRLFNGVLRERCCERANAPFFPLGKYAPAGENKA